MWVPLLWAHPVLNRVEISWASSSSWGLRTERARAPRYGCDVAGTWTCLHPVGTVRARPLSCYAVACRLRGTRTQLCHHRARLLYARAPRHRLRGAPGWVISRNQMFERRSFQPSGREEGLDGRVQRWWCCCSSSPCWYPRLRLLKGTWGGNICEGSMTEGETYMRTRERHHASSASLQLRTCADGL